MTSPLPIALPSGERAVVTRSLVKRYGNVTALRELALEVPRGGFYLLVGPNGAGKSTVLKLLLDLTRPTEGTVEVFGLDARRDGPAVRANIGYVPERPDWAYTWMTVGRALEHHARYFSHWDAQYASQLANTFDVRLDRRLGALSKGQARRVHLLMALAHRPPLLLLDEPTDGLDPVMRDEALGVLAAHLADTETTVLLSTHHVGEVETLADHVGVLRDGALRAQLPLDELRLRLRRYRAHLAGPWRDPPSLDGAVLRRSRGTREVEWTIWGTESDVAAELSRGGATLSDVTGLTLDEATLTLLSTKG